MLPQFEEPKDFAWGSFKSANGANIRFGHVKPAGEVKGTIVLLPGFREFTEKYFETIRDLTAQGYAVYTLDWRGQGGSDRFLPNKDKAHHEGYDEQLQILDDFVSNHVDKTSKPLNVMAHSMGAHLALRYLHDHPSVFDAAILTAPMFDINTHGVPKPLARQMAKFAKAGGYLDKYIPGGGDWDNAPSDPAASHLSHDQARLDVTPEYFRRKPELAIGDPTYGWVYHTLQSVDILNKEEYLKNIKTPILMEVSGDEKVVIRTATERAAGLMPNCIRYDVPAARHEIWMERDDLRQPWLQTVTQYLKDQHEARLQPKKPIRKARPRAP